MFETKEIVYQKLGMLGSLEIFCQTDGTVQNFGYILPNRWDYSELWRYSDKPMGLFRTLEIFCQTGGNIRNITDVLPKSGGPNRNITNNFSTNWNIRSAINDYLQ